MGLHLAWWQGLGCSRTSVPWADLDWEWWGSCLESFGRPIPREGSSWSYGRSLGWSFWASSSRSGNHEAVDSSSCRDIRAVQAESLGGLSECGKRMVDAELRWPDGRTEGHCESEDTRQSRVSSCFPSSSIVLSRVQSCRQQEEDHRGLPSRSSREFFPRSEPRVRRLSEWICRCWNVSVRPHAVYRGGEWDHFWGRSGRSGRGVGSDLERTEKRNSQVPAVPTIRGSKSIPKILPSRSGRAQA